MRNSASRRLRAERRVCLLIPSSCASVLSEGSRVPLGYSPRNIFLRIRARAISTVLCGIIWDIIAGTGLTNYNYSTLSFLNIFKKPLYICPVFTCCVSVIRGKMSTFIIESSYQPAGIGPPLNNYVSDYKSKNNLGTSWCNRNRKAFTIAHVIAKIKDLRWSWLITKHLRHNC